MQVPRCENGSSYGIKGMVERQETIMGHSLLYHPAVKGTLWTSIGIGIKLICQAIKNIKVHYGPELDMHI